MTSLPASAPGVRPSSPRASGDVSFKRKALALTLLLILASSILNAFFGDRGFIEMLRTRKDLQTLEREIADIRSENQKLLEEVRALKSSPFAIERLAREQLGMVKPGEVVLIIRRPRDD